MGKDYLKKLGLYCILLGDGLVILVVLVFGGLFNIIYFEVMGVVMFMCNFNFWVMFWIVIIVIVFVFVVKMGVGL